MSATGDPKLSKLKSEVKVVQLNHPTNSEQMIYPNPTSKVLHISGENPVNTTITDLRGNNLISSSNQEIDISDLKSGVYIVMMHYLGDKKTTYLKLVIE
jgi:hypothetical protein